MRPLSLPIPPGADDGNQAAMAGVGGATLQRPVSRPNILPPWPEGAGPRADVPERGRVAGSASSVTLATKQYPRPATFSMNRAPIL